MYDDWTKCEQCKCFDPDKYYCNRMLHSVTIGCPYGEEKYTMVVAKRGAGRIAFEERKKNNK